MLRPATLLTAAILVLSLPSASSFTFRFAPCRGIVVTMRCLLACCMAVAIVPLMTEYSQAGIIQYSTRAAFEAATNGVTTNDFEGLVPFLTAEGVATPPGLTDGAGVNYTIDHTSSDGRLTIFGKGLFYDDSAVLSTEGSTLGVDNLFITLPGAHTAFAIEIGSFLGDTVTFTLSSGDVFTASSSNILENLGFVGITSDVAFTTIRLDQPTSAFLLNVDNFSFGTADVTAAAVPEPASLTLCGLGACGCAIGAYRRRKHTAQQVVDPETCSV